MNLIEVFTRYPDHEACIEHLEQVRWGDAPACPHCGSRHVARKADGDRVGRWNCHDCHDSYNVLSGTIFSKTKVPLQKWFLAVALMVNAKKSLSSCQLARDLDLNQKTAWFLMQRVRAEMATKQSAILLQGIVEADETYVGGRPRKGNRREDDTPSPRGRATKKTPVIGAVERGGNVVAQVASDLTGRGVLDFIKDTVSLAGSLLISDEFRSYRSVREHMAHAVIRHKVQYVDGLTHTNTIEGFWSLLKRAWYGQHHHYDRDYTPLYVAEAGWKYNQRADEPRDSFLGFFAGCFAPAA